MNKKEKEIARRNGVMANIFKLLKEAKIGTDAKIIIEIDGKKIGEVLMNFENDIII